ncbi:MAG: hypothetical protein RSG53_08915 [Oscillospiraceae bacterium]
MTVRGDTAPANAFSVDENAKRPDIVMVRFYENVDKFSEAAGELTISGWKWNEYHLNLDKYGDMATDILGNFDALLAQAKMQDSGSEESEDAWAALSAALNEGVNTIDG